MRDDADRLAVAHDRDAGDVLRARQFEHVADRRLGTDRDRVVDDAAFETLDAADLARLRLDRHVLVHDADAAFLRDRDREAVLGDRVHGGRHDRQVQADGAGELRGEADFVRQHFGVGRHEQDVIEGEGFLENAQHVATRA